MTEFLVMFLSSVCAAINTSDQIAVAVEKGSGPVSWTPDGLLWQLVQLAAVSPVSSVFSFLCKEHMCPSPVLT